MGVQRGLDLTVDCAHLGGERILPPRELGQTDAVLSGDGTLPAQDLVKKFVESGFGPAAGRRVFPIPHHDIHMNIAIPRVAEAGDGEPAFLLQAGGEAHEVDEPGARHDDIFVQFAQTGGFERGGETPADIPDALAGGFVAGHRDPGGLHGAEESGQIGQFRKHAALLPVDFENEVGVARRNGDIRTEGAGGLESEGIGHFDGGGQETLPENGLHGGGSGFDIGETGGDGSAKRRVGEEAKGGLADNSQQTLGAGEKAHEIEAGFVFVGAPADAEDASIHEHDFEAEEVLPGDAVFEAARSTGVGGDISADAAIFQAGRIWWIKQAAGPGFGLQVPSDDSRLHDGDKIPGVDFENFVHALDAEQHAVFHWHATAHIAVAGTARGYRHPGGVAGTKDGGDLRGRARENGGRRSGVGKPTIGSVGNGFRAKETVSRGEDAPELVS